MIMHCDIPRSAGGRPAIAEDGRWLGSLRDELQALLAPLFCQARSRLTAFAYLDALLAEPGDRRSCWQLAEAARHTSPRRMQALLAEHAWEGWHPEAGDDRGLFQALAAAASGWSLLSGTRLRSA
jgi:hypothetical protein